MKPMHLARFGLLLPLLAICGGEIQALTQAEKNAFLSRKKWYVTAEFYINGNGANGEHQYSINSSSRVRLELNHAIPGQWPMSSPPDASQPIPTGRYISWMAMPTEAANAAIERGETNPANLPNMYYPMSADVNARFSGPSGNGTGIDTYQGSGGGYAIGNCMLSLDLNEGVFDLVFQVGGAIWPKVTHAWDYPDPPDGRGDGSEEHQGQAYKAWMDSNATVSLSHRILRRDMKQDGSISFTIRTNSLVTVPVGRPTIAYSAIFRISPNPPTTAKLILEPEQSYVGWRPKAGNSETEEGEYLNVKWRVEEPGLPAGQRPKVNRVTFRLGGVSKYPGVCMNWPLPQATPPGAQPTGPKFDLAFPKPHTDDRDRTVREENQVLIIDGNSAKAAFGGININCYDGAAIGELVAEAEMVDGRILQCEVAGQSGRNKVLIPDREEGVSDLARAWRTQFATGLADGGDEEDVPVGDGQKGDGLTVWEEYRGFRIQGEWSDECDPKKKDLFVDNRIGAAAEGGIELLRNATDINVHSLLNEREHLPDRKINFNKRSDRWVVDQHCLILTQSPHANFGICNPRLGKNMGGPPKNTNVVHAVLGLGEDRVYGTSVPGVLAAGNNQSHHIAHELCHAIGIWHHGDKDPWTGGNFGIIWKPYLTSPETAVVERGSPFQIVQEPLGTPVNPRQYFASSNEFLAKLGMPNGQHSGNFDCIMRYNAAKFYIHAVTPTIRVSHGQRERGGSTLCTTAAGTDFNGTSNRPNSRYRDADVQKLRGNCVHQFVISDRWEAQDRK